MSDGISRRDLLKTTGAAAIAAGAAGCATAPLHGESQGLPRRIARIAHLTDIHVQPERRAEEWLARCLHHAQAQPDPPGLILNGGDVIMDALQATADRTRVQWESMRRVFRDECSLPVVHCIGNHDVWGWNREKSGADAGDPLYGKAWALEMLGLARGYYRKSLGTWEMIVLDSTHPGASRTYDARLDDEQFDWLAGELAAIAPSRPVLILSHIPILAACAYFDGDNEKTGDWVVPGSWVHIDARRIKDLFARHPNVRLAISGHIHLLDRVDYNGVTYLCNGAVSGNWWKGDYQETPPGYAMVNLYEDGGFDSEYVTYGWKGEG